MDILNLWLEIVLASVPGLVISGALLYVIEKFTHWDERVRKGELAAAVYGGLRVVAYAILIASMLK